MALTRKSTRPRVPTTKAKQYEASIKPSKPVLRSISTIDENENTYNNVNFKRRRLNEVAEQQEEEDDMFSVSDDENIFNSDNEDYTSGVSDYEADSKPPFKSMITAKQSTDELHSHINLTHNNFLGMDALFDTDESDSDSPITPVSSIMDAFELKSLEENFQKIAHENSSTPSPPSSPKEQEPQQSSSVTIEECLNYHGSLDENPSTHEFSKPKFLQYRHDERHNLAFPDVSTFPVRYDPLVSTSMKKMGNTTKRVRALTRRAILSGKASEMVGTGITIGDFML